MEYKQGNNITGSPLSAGPTIPFAEKSDEEDTFHFYKTEIPTAHLKRLTTRVGIVRCSQIDIPDTGSGYALKDNALALIAILRHYELTGKAEDKILIETYLNFILYNQRSDGRFTNYVDKNGKRKADPETGELEEAEALSVWALGEFISKKHLFHAYYSDVAEYILLNHLLNLEKMVSPKAIAMAIKGLFNYNTIKKNKNICDLIALLADKLIYRYRAAQDSNWFWYENSITCSDSVLSEAVLCAHLCTGKNTYKIIAHNTFDFLLACFFGGDTISVQSAVSPKKNNVEKHSLLLTPVDVSFAINALDTFYSTNREECYSKHLKTAFTWFNGNNHLHRVLNDPSSGGCCDYIGESTVNLNQGAQSTAAYLMARCVHHKYMQETNTMDSPLNKTLLNKPFAPSKTDFLNKFSLILSS